MLLDMDLAGENYSIEDFEQEAMEQANEGNISPHELDQLCFMT